MPKHDLPAILRRNQGVQLTAGRSLRQRPSRRRPPYGDRPASRPSGFMSPLATSPSRIRAPHRAHRPAPARPLTPQKNTPVAFSALERSATPVAAAKAIEMYSTDYYLACAVGGVGVDDFMAEYCSKFSFRFQLCQ